MPSLAPSALPDDTRPSPERSPAPAAPAAPAKSPHAYSTYIPSSPLSRSDAPALPRALSDSPHSPSSHPRRVLHSHSESLIGSYEESLLSGRTSTPSCKPAVAFQARVGVLGTGDDCPAKLKCPKHLSLEFEAVYYDWPEHNTGGARGTPYVGMLELDEYYKDRKGLGYRVPKQGQIQIVISNPHRTAIKLFLVPYDLADMPAGTRTFVRQKTVAVDAGKQRLRQAAHLHFVCPAAGRYYLFKTARVVFENRALDATSAPSTTETVRVETITAEYSKYADTSLKGLVHDTAGLSLSASKLDHKPAEELITWAELYNRRINNI